MTISPDRQMRSSQSGREMRVPTLSLTKLERYLNSVQSSNLWTIRSGTSLNRFPKAYSSEPSLVTLEGTLRRCLSNDEIVQENEASAGHREGGRWRKRLRPKTLR